MAPLDDLKPSSPGKASGGKSSEDLDVTGGFRTKEALRLGYGRIWQRHCRTRSVIMRFLGHVTSQAPHRLI
jgi:hypothetical protein